MRSKRAGELCSPPARSHKHSQPGGEGRQRGLPGESATYLVVVAGVVVAGVVVAAVVVFLSSFLPQPTEKPMAQIRANEQTTASSFFTAKPSFP